MFQQFLYLHVSFFSFFFLQVVSLCTYKQTYVHAYTNDFRHTNACTAGKQRPTLQPDLVSGVAESAATPLGKQRERESVQTLTSSYSHGILRRGAFVFINPPVS